jgi:hypothetical protein
MHEISWRLIFHYRTLLHQTNHILSVPGKIWSCCKIIFSIPAKLLHCCCKDCLTRHIRDSGEFTTKAHLITICKNVGSNTHDQPKREQANSGSQQQKQQPPLLPVGEGEGDGGATAAGCAPT